ncbi:MAG: class I adenylate-forming enzyme family protein [Actinomycetota bacterium]|nr:class I adenylate-forming enzyme family protein [Actinomycetota bacterium]
MDLQTINEGVVRAVADRPNTIALADAPNRASFFSGDPVRLTWAEVDGAINTVARSLQSMGVGPGSAVAIQLPNIVELPLTILACARLGAVAVPFPIQHRSHELRYGLGVSDATVMVTGARPDRPDQLDAVAGVIAELGADITIGVCGSETIDGATELDISTDGAPPETSAPTAGDVTTVCWTSGTTGTPKGVPRTNSMWLASGGFQVDQLALSAGDRILCPFPVVNMAGIGGMLVPWAMVGATLHLHQPLDLPVFLQQMATEQITYTVAPPPLLNMLLANEAMLDSVDLSHVRMISSGSAPLDPWMVEGWEQRGIEIVNVFGSNEGASMLSTRAMVPDPAQRARFFPRADREGVHTRLVDIDSGAEITEAGRSGELRFSGSTVFAGYLESTGEEFDDQGYYRTGDLFEWVEGDNEPRLLRFVDRAKDIIIRGGMNVSAAEVEGLVSSHDSVVECAAVAYPDHDLGERVGVFVVAAAEAEPTLETLTAHLRELGVASYKLPERVELIEALPRNPVGKVTKPELRERWAN